MLNKTTLNQELPGIVSLFAFSPSTGSIMNQLAEELLRNPEFSTFTPGERELIAAITSAINRTQFCRKSHTEFAILTLKNEGCTLEVQKFIDLVKDCNSSEQEESAELLDSAGMSERKWLTIVGIIGMVSVDNFEFTDQIMLKMLITACNASEDEKDHFSDKEIHDVVLIASAFAMYNRYVKFLEAPLPTEEAYPTMAERIVAEGYVS